MTKAKNPYFIEDLPAVVSFSGGRTSGFMLRHILDAHGGQPENLRICFQNTGLEHPATYEFILRVAEEWAIDVTWLEYCLDDEEKHDFKVVDFDSASRGGGALHPADRQKGVPPQCHSSHMHLEFENSHP